MKRLRFLTITMALLAGVTASCLSTSQVRIEWAGSNLPGRMTYRYALFTGQESGSLEAELGQTIALSYEATVNEGTLSIEVRGPQGQIIWQVQLEGDEAESVQIPVPEAGKHTVTMVGRDAAGSFDVEWQVEE